MKHKFSYKIRFIDIFLLMLGFALAIYDMWALKDGVNKILPSADMNFGAPAIAFILATIANTCALEWGISNGKNKTKHLFTIGTLGWIVFGIVYIVIEYSAAVSEKTTGQAVQIGQIGQYIILAASYIISGLMIKKGAREINDADASSCRVAEKEYKIAMKRLARMDSRINYILSALENYNQNYDSLNEQYIKQQEAINHAEDSTINEILGKTLQENPEVTPSEAQKVIEQAKRDYKAA